MNIIENNSESILVEKVLGFLQDTKVPKSSKNYGSDRNWKVYNG